MKKIVLPIITLFLLISCGSTKEPVNSSSSLLTSSSSEIKEEITYTFNALESPLEVESTLLKEWLQQENYDYKDMNAYINGKSDLGDNLPIHLSFTSSKDFETCYLLVKEKNGEEIQQHELSDNSFDFINYKLNTEYSVWISNDKNDKTTKDNAITFVTPAATYRTISVDGVNNFRDLGDGKLIKQGLIYRSATFENNTSIDEDHPISISEEGKTKIASLNLKSEIDLRKDDEKSESYINKSYLNLNYLKAPLYYGGQNILTYNKNDYNNPETIKNIFEFLANKENYPVNFHCVRGTDRTGCIAYLIKGLLGVDEETLYRDFLFSNFYNIGSPVKLESIYYATNPNATTRYVNVIHQTEGETLKDKIYNYLTSDKIGVSNDKLDAIINLLKA